jgi:hypothetical protein
MRFGKLGMFLYFNGVIAIGLLIYFGLWMLGNKTTGKVVAPFYDTKINAEYIVGETTYYGSYMRYDLPSRVYTIPLRYLPYAPSYSRVNSFMGIFAEPLAWWSLFFVSSALLLLTDNTVFSKGTVFQLKRKFPWISMEEYFRLPWWYSASDDHDQSDPPHNADTQKEISS